MTFNDDSGVFRRSWMLLFVLLILSETDVGERTLRSTCLGREGDKVRDEITPEKWSRGTEG